MLTINLAFNVPALLIVVAVTFYLLIHFVLKRRREREQARIDQLITGVISDYFEKTDLDVSATCYHLPDGKGLVALIESEPLKRFRYSHIIELFLQKRILKVSGKEVGKIYWRFPLPKKFEEGTLQPLQEKATGDLYLEQSYLEAETLTQIPADVSYEVGETSWENFERALRPGDEKEKNSKPS